jgi:hypothetical protein
MIITSNIDSLFQCQTSFGLLKTDDLACEKNNKSGYNSSIIIWRGAEFSKIYSVLKENFKIITKFIVRFDFWLEMMVKHADFLQNLLPNKISDFLKECQNGVPSETSVVCFPRTPKPDAFPAEWIKEYWI